MRLSEFDYELPKELIAQHPSERRGDDRLLVLDRRRGAFCERHFGDIAEYFKPGDVLVLNDTKVIPARLFGKRKTGGKVEIFVLDSRFRGNDRGYGDDKRLAEALVRSSRRIKPGESVTLESGGEARVLGRAGIGRALEFDEEVGAVLKREGHVPLPPYISRRDEPADAERYQTVYAEREGATAAPTAGLHFTKEAIDGLKKKGVIVACVTLHVSYGTFRPVKEEVVERHRMHSEFYRVSEEPARVIKEALGRRARIFACGTTSLRALETCAGVEKCCDGYTELFIYPGYEFKVVDALITNFHLPKSTLLLLASAFAGKDLLFRAYEHAIRERFRFFSYGDAMLIL